MRKSFAFINGWLLALTLFAAPLIAAPEKVRSVEGITEYKLENGLHVLLYPDPSLPKVTVNLTVLVGSRHEGYGETGMAHLLEHMLFKGTPDHPDIPGVMKERGARFNGSTWLDRTNYYETLPASDDNLEFAIKLEADRMVNSPIKAEDLATEFSVVRNEFESGENSPYRVLSQRMMAVAYEWHNYGKSTIGNRTDIERVPVDNLRAFYRTYYQPDNALVVIAGRFEEKKALGYVEKYFGAIPKPERKLRSTYTEEPPQDGERFVTLRRVGTVAIVGLAYHVPSGPHPEFPAVEILGQVLSSEPSGRLYKALVEKQLATDVEAGAQPLHDPGTFDIYAEVDTKDPAKLAVVRDAIYAALDELIQSGVTKEEVNRARQSILKNWELSLHDSNRVAIELSEWAAQGDWRLFFLHRDRIEKVTPAQVQEVAAHYLTPSNRTVGFFIPSERPERTPVPASPDIATLMKDYKGRKVESSAGEAFDVNPMAIEARIQRPDPIDGVKLAFLPKKTRGNSVQMRLTLHYGNAENLKGFNVAASMLPEMMMRGTKSMTRQQIEDALDKNFARMGGGGRMHSLSGGGGPGSLTFALETKRANLPAVLEILRQVLREPSFPEKEFEILQREEIAGIEQGLTDPIRLGAKKFSRSLNPYPKDDVRYVPTMEEDLERERAVTLDQVKALYHGYIGAGHGELVVVGDFEPSEILPILGKTLDDWKAEKPYARIERPIPPGIKPEQATIKTPDKANAVFLAGLQIPMKDSDPDYAAMVAGNFILGGGSLSSRIADRLRQKGGLSYTAASIFSAHSLDRNAAFRVYAIYNPTNVEKVKAGAVEEIERILKDGVTDGELKQARTGLLQQRQVQRSNDRALSALIASDLYLGRTMQFEADEEQKIRDLNTEAVNAALRKYLDPKKLTIVTAGDFDKK